MNQAIRIVLLCLFALSAHAQPGPRKCVLQLLTAKQAARYAVNSALSSHWVVSSNHGLSPNLWRQLELLIDEPVELLCVDAPDTESLALALLNTPATERQTNLITGVMELAMRDQHGVPEAGIWPEAIRPVEGPAVIRVRLFQNPALVVGALRHGITQNGLLALHTRPTPGTRLLTQYRRVGPPVAENIVHSRF